MNPWIGNSIFILTAVLSVLIRLPHDKIRQQNKIKESRLDLREKGVLFLLTIGMLILPILSFTPLLSFAAFEPSPLSIVLGTLVMGAALWLFRRSHEDLGKNWSPTLEIREGHSLVTGGVYATIRHPMYSSLLLMAIGQLLLIANWIAGPAMLFGFAALFFTRLHTEEKMMLDQFGEQYEAYRRKTKRLVPGLW